MSERRGRFVALSQQALACAVVAALAVPALGVVSLDIVAPPSGGAGSGARGALVASAPVVPEVREVPLTETRAQRGSAAKQSLDPEGVSTRLTARASAALAPQPTDEEALILA